MSRALGMNARNAHIARRNPRWAIVDAKDKLLTKRRLASAGLPVPPTLAQVENRRRAKRFDVGSLPDRFVVKPSRGSMGRGVLVVSGRDGTSWMTARGLLDAEGIGTHLLAILDGEFSQDDHEAALIEPLLVSDRSLAPLAPTGLPDIRIIVDAERPLIAMLRMPTITSGGRGNLHQGGIGAAIELTTGRLHSAVSDGRVIDAHPDTGARFDDVALPHWNQILAIAARCGEATGLGYLGVDLVIDAQRGPLVLEVNSHPGLEIQNVCRRSIDIG